MRVNNFCLFCRHGGTSFWYSWVLIIIAHFEEGGDFSHQKSFEGFLHWSLNMTSGSGRSYLTASFWTYFDHVRLLTVASSIRYLTTWILQNAGPSRLRQACIHGIVSSQNSMSTLDPMTVVLVLDAPNRIRYLLP